MKKQNLLTTTNISGNELELRNKEGKSKIGHFDTETTRIQVAAGVVWDVLGYDLMPEKVLG